MLHTITNTNYLKVIKKNPAYVRLRLQLPGGKTTYLDDQGVYDFGDELLLNSTAFL